MKRFITVVLAVCCTVSLLAAPPAEIEVVCVDEQATGYGTFQSHNQKVLANGGGIFMTHLRTRNEPFTAQQWRLSRSSDGGRTFATVHEATSATHTPAIATDEHDNVYLIRSDFADGNAYLHTFSAAGGYRAGRVTPIPRGSAQKFAICYDRERQQLYHASYGRFDVIGLDGAIRSSLQLFQNGPNAEMQYPSLCLDPAGILHLAWTTVAHGRYLYWSIHFMQSRDGGATWRNADGTVLTPPIVADDTGPGQRVSLDDEFEVHTWLSNFLVREGKGHFLYLARTDPPRQHYVRYDLLTGERELDLSPRLKGDTIELSGLDGFFAMSPSTLYCAGHTTDGRVGCLASKDNGGTWTDHAVSRKVEGLYAVGGCPRVTAEGFVIGSFTEALPSSTDATSTAKVHFFRIPGAP